MADRTDLPQTLVDLIDAVLDAAGLDGDARDEVARDLRDHFEDGLASGLSADALASRFGNPASAGRRIAQARAGGGTFETGALFGGSDEGQSAGGRSSTFDRIRLELKYAFRALRRAPAFSMLVLATLALGVGANTAVFSVLDAVLLQPLPYDDPGQLVRVEESWDGGDNSVYMRAPLISAMEEWDEVFAEVGAFYTYRETGADLTGGDRPERIIAVFASDGFFKALGGNPLLGRTFSSEEIYSADGPGAITVMSHGLWNRRFGSDPNIVGQTIELDGQSVEVIGVMRHDFMNPFGSAADVWLPQAMTLGGRNNWGNYFLSTVARLQDGVSVEAARARIPVLSAALKEAEPDSGELWAVVITPLQDHIVGGERRSMLWLLAAAVGLVLLSACVNVGNLVFARSLDREREVALRGALGSSRSRLVSHLLVENVLLAIGGSLLGLALGLLGVRALLAVAPDALPGLAEPGLSPGVFGFALAAMVASLVVFGLAPTLRLAGVPPSDVLRGGGRGGTESGGLRRVRSTLVVAQVAVALVLLVGAGLLVRSFNALQNVDLGLQPDQMYTYEVHLPLARYPEGADREAFHQEYQERVAALPGVDAVGSTSWLPLNGRFNIWGTPNRVEDPIPYEELQWAADVRMIGGDYFRAAGIEFIRGQRPAEADLEGEDLVWISQLVADRLFPDSDPIGAQIRAANRERRVVGIVADVAWDSRGSKDPTVYVAHAQYADDRNWAMTQVVRTRGDFASLRAGLVSSLASVDGDLVVFRARPMDTFVEIARAQDRFALLLMTVFAGLAMVLAGVGTYGILAGSVAKRSREIGIRMALGADAGSVRASIMRSALAMVVGGAAIGGLVAWIGSRWLTSMLFQVTPTDPVTYGGAALVLLALGTVASFIPAHRATRIDPARTLTDA